MMANLQGVSQRKSFSFLPAAACRLIHRTTSGNKCLGQAQKQSDIIPRDQRKKIRRKVPTLCSLGDNPLWAKRYEAFSLWEDEDGMMEASGVVSGETEQPFLTQLPTRRPSHSGDSLTAWASSYKPKDDDELSSASTEMGPSRKISTSSILTEDEPFSAKHTLSERGLDNNPDVCFI